MRGSRAMRIALILFAGLFRPAAAARAEASSQDVARQAFEACNKSDWPRAIELYKQLVDRGAGDAGVYFNLGTAYAKAGDMGRAVLNLELARRLDPTDPDIIANLNLVAPEHGARLAATPIPPLELLLAQASMNGWARSAQFLTIVAFAGLAVVFSLRKGSVWRPRIKTLVVAGGLCAAFAHGCAWIKYNNEVGTLRGVVVGAPAKPAVSPDPAASSLDFTLPPGSIITLRHAGVKGWVKANYAGRVEFFLPENAVELLRFQGQS